MVEDIVNRKCAQLSLWKDCSSATFIERIVPEYFELFNSDRADVRVFSVLSGRTVDLNMRNYAHHMMEKTISESGIY